MVKLCYDKKILELYYPYKTPCTYVVLRVMIESKRCTTPAVSAIDGDSTNKISKSLDMSGFSSDQLGQCGRHVPLSL